MIKYKKKFLIIENLSVKKIKIIIAVNIYNSKLTEIFLNFFFSTVTDIKPRVPDTIAKLNANNILSKNVLRYLL